MGGFPAAIESLLASPSTAPLLTRERISPWFFFSYTFIPLSTIAFPHIAIFCLTARRMAQFKRTVILYPLCILAIWLPCVFLGVAANSLRDVPRIEQKLEARAALAALPPSAPAEERAALRRQAAGDDVVLVMLERFAPLWLAGLLGAGIMAAVMASDSQILALSTMFTEDVFAFYGGTARFGENVQVQTGRLFVVVLTLIAYLIALRVPQGIFDLAVQFAFSGYSALSPLLFAALFWKRSTKWGALAVTLWVAFAVIYTWRVPGALAWYGLMPVVPMTLISCALMLVVSLIDAHRRASCGDGCHATSTSTSHTEPVSRVRFLVGCRRRRTGARSLNAVPVHCWAASSARARRGMNGRGSNGRPRGGKLASSRMRWRRRRCREFRVASKRAPARSRAARSALSSARARREQRGVAVLARPRAFQRTTCGSRMARARPCVMLKRAVSGFAQACAAPSIDCSIAIPAKCAPSSIAARASASSPSDSTAGYAPLQQLPGVVRKEIGQRRSARRHRRLDGMCDGIESSHRRDAGAARSRSVPDRGSRSGTRRTDRRTPSSCASRHRR